MSLNDRDNRESFQLRDSKLAYSLSPPVFTSREFWNAERIGALVLYCSDGRWGEAFDEFCHIRLRIPRYDRFAVPGGPAWLIGSETSADFFQSSCEQLDFLVRVHELERIVLITHFGCAYYGEILGGKPEEYLPRQVQDLCRAANILRTWFPELDVETFVAMRRGILLSFHGVEESRCWP
jgi:hypothetical protein